jgi:orotate phosphoribosyltransferase
MPFQVCACEPSGPPIGSAIQAHASRLGVPLNLFIARRAHKEFGTDNWFDGRVLPGLPVLIVDDIAASSPFMLNASVRIQVKLGLPLHHQYFTIVNKVGRFKKQSQHTENYLDGQLISLFTMNNFCQDVEQFRDRYGEGPKWTGIVK